MKWSRNCSGVSGRARVRLDDLVAEDMVNHAAGPQGRSGLAQTLSTIDHDLGPVTVEQHHLVGDGDVVAQHLTSWRST